METLTIISEPRNSVYVELLQFVAQHCDRFGLVCRPHDSLNSSATDLLNRIQPYCVECYQSEQWPGTVLVDARAQISIYQLGDATLGILLETAGSLFDWLHPALPEDLFTLRPDGSWMLGSIAHECDAFMQLSRKEFEALVASCPHLILRKS